MRFGTYFLVQGCNYFQNFNGLNSHQQFLLYFYLKFQFNEKTHNPYRNCFIFL